MRTLDWSMTLTPPLPIVRQSDVIGRCPQTERPLVMLVCLRPRHPLRLWIEYVLWVSLQMVANAMVMVMVVAAGVASLSSAPEFLTRQRSEP